MKLAIKHEFIQKKKRKKNLKKNYFNFLKNKYKILLEFVTNENFGELKKYKLFF